MQDVAPSKGLDDRAKEILVSRATSLTPPSRKVVGGPYDLDSGEFKLVEAKRASAKPADELMHVTNSQ